MTRAVDVAKQQCLFIANVVPQVPVSDEGVSLLVSHTDGDTIRESSYLHGVTVQSARGATNPALANTETIFCAFIH